MTRAAVAPRRNLTKIASARPRPVVPKDYFTQSQLPLTCLVFLLPLIATYELGTHYITRQQIIAFGLVQDFFHFLGATGPHLPALAVVFILLTWHIARNDIWHVQSRILGYMSLECLLLAIPIIVLSMVASWYIPRITLMATGPTRTGMLVLSCGAGIYEELVFRLIAFTLLNLLFVDIFKTRKQLSALLIVVIPAILFSIYHYLGHERFTLQTFLFRTLAGIYFGVLFLYRGFGITAGTHASYDIIVTLLT